VTKNVRDMMSAKIQTIRSSETAKDAAKKMVDKNVSSLIVVDNDEQSMGIITERDIARGVCIHDAFSKDFKVHHLMSSPLSAIDPNSSTEEAANLMLQYKVRHLLVKDGDRTLGIITASNFIDYLNEQLDLDDPKAKVLKTLKDQV
jgi:signal-transduction protein with cAMP-binding, CBS, and nucleotidyltransferase domain